MSRNTLLKTPFSEVCDLGNLLRNIVNLILLFCDHYTLSYAAYNMPTSFPGSLILPPRASGMMRDPGNEVDNMPPFFTIEGWLIINY